MGSRVFGIVCLVMFHSWGVMASHQITCMEKCFLEHPDWGHPQCAKVSDSYIAGPKCVEVYGHCHQSCNAPLDASKKAFMKGMLQQEDHWIPGELCSENMPKIPILPLGAKTMIRRHWGGHCECLNGRLIEASCPHPPASCYQACNEGKRIAF